MTTVDYPQYGYRRWKAPVATSGDLPTVGNVTGDVRLALDTGTQYYWDGSAWGVAGGTLGGLSDVTITSPQDGQKLFYDSGSGNWVNDYEQESITDVVVGPTNAYTISVVTGIYHIDTSTSTGDVTVTLPDSAAGNNGYRCRIIVKDPTQRVLVVTASGQTIGGETTQYLIDDEKGITVVSESAVPGYLVVQDSRGTFPNDNNTNSSIFTTNRFLNYSLSASVVSGFDITKNVGAGTIDVAAGECVIRTTSAGPNSILNSQWYTGDSGLAITDATPSYVKLDSSSGSPVVSITTDPTDFNGETSFLVGYVFRSGTSYMDVFSPGSQSLNFVNRWATRDFFVNGVVRGSGSVLSSPSGFDIAVTAGLFYSVLTAITTSAFDSTGVDTHTLIWRSGASTWTRTTGQSGIDNTTFNNLTTNTLDTISPAVQFGVSYVYWQFDTPERLIELKGQAQYGTLAAAQAAAQTAPTVLPPELQQGPVTFFLGSVVYQGSGSAFNNVYNVTSTSFSAGVTTDHNDLSGLQGGTGSQYYHLTSAQHSNLTGGAPTFGTSVTTPSLDTAAGTLSIGTGAATQIDIGGAGVIVTTNILGDTVNIGEAGGTINLLGATNVINTSDAYVSGALEVDGRLDADGGLDRSTAAALSIGATNATQVNIDSTTIVNGTGLGVGVTPDGLLTTSDGVQLLPAGKMTSVRSAGSSLALARYTSVGSVADLYYGATIGALSQVGGIGVDASYVYFYGGTTYTNGLRLNGSSIYTALATTVANRLSVTSGSISNFSIWGASNQLNFAGGTSGLAWYTTGGTKIGDLTNTGAWTLGDSAGGVTHTRYGAQKADWTNKTTGTIATNVSVANLDIYFNSGAAGNVDGFSGGVAGQVLHYVSGGSASVTFRHAQTATQAFRLPGNADITLGNYGGALFICDGSVWVMLSHTN